MNAVDTEKLITDNMGLINLAARRYVGFGVDYDDLFQIGAVGLVKAAKGYDEGRGLRFSTYAVAKIAGEIKTYLRDNGQVKVPRSVKERKLKLERARGELMKELGREPRISEIAQRCGMEPEDAVYALDATQATVSLDLPPDEGGVTVADGTREEERTLDRVTVAQLLGSLDAEERRVIVMRFFEDKTQAEISKELGMSQVAVSRLEKKILQKLRKLAGEK